MKKILIMLFSLFLVSCNMTAETPEDALKKLDSKEDTLKITNILNSGSNNPKQGFYVFKGEVDNKNEWFVANVVTNDLYWYVKDFINIGEPNNEDASYSSQANTFIAGISNEFDEKKDDRIIIPIPENEFFVWIEVFENQK